MIKEQTATQEPNVVIPFASSYQSRNIAGYTNVITNAVDQRKINCIYEPAVNSPGGENMTLYLAKRPGVADSGSSYGTAGQVGYFHEVAAGAATSAAANRWVFSTSGDDVRVSDTSVTTVIVTASGYAPAFVDKTIIAGVDTVVLQLRNTAGTQRVFYSTTIGTWTEITDTDFTTLAHQGKMEFLNGATYSLGRSGSRIYNSALNSLSDWPATGFITKQITQDIATGLAKLGDFIVAFGESTMEVFRDNGNATGSPLIAATDRFQRVGLASTIITGMRSYYTVIDNNMFWVSSNPKGLYVFNGDRVEKVSSIGIDKILAEQQHYYVSHTTFQGQRAVVIGLSLPTATTQRALLFFPDWKDWFEWTSTVFTPITSQRLTNVFLGVDQNMHKLYNISQSSDTYQDAGGNFTMSCQFKLPSTGNHIKRMSMCGLIADTSRSAQTVSVSWSNDDYQTFSTARTIDMTKETKMLRQCGSFRSRVFKLENTDSLGLRMEKFIGRAD